MFLELIIIVFQSFNQVFVDFDVMKLFDLYFKHHLLFVIITDLTKVLVSLPCLSCLGLHLKEGFIRFDLN